MNKVSAKDAERIGVVATDALRLMGLQSVLKQYKIVCLTLSDAMDEANLSLVLIDSSCTGHLFELLASFRHLRPKLKLIVIGSETDHEYIQRVIGSGAKGYFSLSAKGSEIQMAIDVVRDGSIWAPRKVLARLLESQPGTSNQPITPPNFTARELQVLTLLRDGQPNREIALTLGIDEGTVKAHIGRLLRKVGVTNRTALTVHPSTQIE
ncbi:MAG: response regulator transcription factor [Acidobacteriaceae bacterium]|nr:response regulator transcription factor [Acidobacteriaceae bacterium]